MFETLLVVVLVVDKLTRDKQPLLVNIVKC